MKEPNFLFESLIPNKINNKKKKDLKCFLTTFNIKKQEKNWLGVLKVQKQAGGLWKYKEVQLHDVIVEIKLDMFESCSALKCNE